MYCWIIVYDQLTSYVHYLFKYCWQIVVIFLIYYWNLLFISVFVFIWNFICLRLSKCCLDHWFKLSDCSKLVNTFSPPMPTTTCLTCWTSMRFCHLDSLPSSPLWKSTMIDLLHDQLLKSTENQKKSRKCLSMETANSKMVATMDCTMEWVQPSRGSCEQTRACSNVHVVSILNMCAYWCKTYVVEIKGLL